MIQPLLELLDAESSSVGSEYFINSEELQDKVRSLLPSQGGAGAGFDLSASTQIVPVIDLTESAEGSSVRADLQTALSLTSVTSFNVSNTTTTLVNNTGYYRVSGLGLVDSAGSCRLELTDGVTTKILRNFDGITNLEFVQSFDFIVFLKAGDSLVGVSSAGTAKLNGTTRQIATVTGDLVNP